MSINVIGIRRSGIDTISKYITELSKLPCNNNLNHELYLSDKLPDKSVNVFEEVDLIKFNTIKLKNDKDTTIKNVIVIRDPLNMAASRIKHYNLISSEGLFISPLALHQWFTYFNFYTNKKNVSDIPTLYINYNKFISSASYRCSIMNSLINVENHKESCAETKILQSININQWDGRTFDGTIHHRWNETHYKRYQYYWEVDAFRNLLTEEQKTIIEKEFDIVYEGREI